MTSTSRIARATACAFLLAIPAGAVANDAASIRAEGPDGTVLPKRFANVPSGGTSTLVDPISGETTTVPNNRGTSFLLRSAEAGGVSVGFRVYNFGTPSAMITRIGSVASPTNWAWSWMLKVNHRAASVGSDDVVIRPGDDILWMPSVYGVPDSELDVVAPAEPRAVGEPFTVRVDRYDNNAVRTPGSGVSVTYGGQVVAAGADGTARLTALPGWVEVVATAPHPGGIGQVRDSERLCGFAPAQPEACGLDPVATRLPDVAPNQAIASTPTTILTRVTTSSGKPVEVDVRIPLRGQQPARISAADITDAELSPSERREALGSLGSSLAWQLNHRAGQGDATVRPPRGTSWRAAWMGTAVTVSPLARGEALITQGVESRQGAARASRVVTAANRALDACGLDATARSTARFGYSMVIIAPPATGARRCLAAR